METHLVNILLDLRPVFLILLGSLLATLSSLLAIRQQASLARRVRMQERLAEKKVEVNGQAYAKAKLIQSMLLTKELGVVLKQMACDESWVFENRLFLPGKFPDRWFGTRTCLEEALIFQQALKEEDKTRFLSLRQKAQELIENAIREVYKDVGLDELHVELLDTTVTEFQKRSKA